MEDSEETETYKNSNIGDFVVGEVDDFYLSPSNFVGFSSLDKTQLIQLIDPTLVTRW